MYQRVFLSCFLADISVSLLEALSDHWAWRGRTVLPSAGWKGQLSKSTFLHPAPCLWASGSLLRGVTGIVSDFKQVHAVSGMGQEPPSGVQLRGFVALQGCVLVPQLWGFSSTVLILGIRSSSDSWKGPCLS